MDVSALYTNIPNDEGIEAVKNSLKESTSTSLLNVITTFLTLILTLNNFIFNGIHYLQTKGCAMGTKCAPTYANIFMGEFEEKYIYPKIKDKSCKYLRYIDDIFMVWKSSQDELNQFIKEINEVHPSIKFTTESSKTQVNFLDTTIQINDSKLTTKTFKKPTDRSAYLHNTSYHPNQLKNNIPFGQALRLKKICTYEDDYHQSLQQMESSFLKRGYQRNHLINQFNKATNRTRQQLLIKTPVAKTNNLPFITTFHKNLPNIRSAINKHWNILKINPELEETFQNTKPFLAYRRNRNLKDLIGQTTLNNNKVIRKKPKEKGKCRPCLTKSNNLCCRQIQSTSTFTSQQTKKTFTIFHNTTCKSTFVIYLMECRKCHIQYIGKTETAFNQRLNNHRSNAYRPKPDTIPACKHFNGKDHDFNRDAKFTLIEQIGNSKTTVEKQTIILQRENFWITTLRTLTPLGFNQELN